MQLESLPQKRLVLDRNTRRGRPIKDYRALEPVLTLIWLADDTLRFDVPYAAYTMLPELVLEFLQNERLWHQPEIRELLAERQRVLALAAKRTKRLSFLAQNRLIFIFQRNIIKHAPDTRYARWFKFAEKSKNKANAAADFAEFQGDTVFEEIMRRLSHSVWTAEDVEYIEHEHKMWAETARLEHGYYEDGREDGFYEGHAAGRDSEKHAIAEKLLKLGLELAHIAQATGLTLSEIAALSTR